MKWINPRWAAAAAVACALVPLQAAAIKVDLSLSANAGNVELDPVGGCG